MIITTLQFAQSPPVPPAETGEGIFQRGYQYERAGRVDEAIACYRRALELSPELAGIWNNLGNMWELKGDLAEALRCFRQSVALQPDFSMPWSNLGTVLWRTGALEEGIRAYRRAIELQGAEPEFRTHNNLGYALLAAGELAEGFRESQWRPERVKIPGREWQGEDLRESTVLLHFEQGLGDTIQFIRFLPWVAEQAARVLVRCQPPLVLFLQANFPAVTFLPFTEPLPAYDFWYPLVSLPLLCGTTLETIPRATSYLRADAAKSARWRERLAAHLGRKIGLTWAGNIATPHDNRRTIDFALLAPYLELPGLTFVHLQHGPRGAQAAGAPLLDFTGELEDFTDTAALIDTLDLILTVDTSIAHLAGALGRPVWLMLPFDPDWRWLRERTDSPWYPTVRLFRQKTFAAWGPVLEEVRAALVALGAS